jgi:hypothetical protein
VTLTNSYIKDDYCTGGITGFANAATIQNCENAAYIIGSMEAGGIAGYNTYVITGCKNTGIVAGAYDVGGIAGFCSEPSIEYCANEGLVYGRRRRWRYRGLF